MSSSDFHDIISEAKQLNLDLENLFYPKVFSFRTFEILIYKIPIDQRPDLSLYPDFLDICFSDFYSIPLKSLENYNFIYKTFYDMKHLFIHYIKPSFDISSSDVSS